jgi:glycosyltransferase involved in cell wall biosynthesis
VGQSGNDVSAQERLSVSIALCTHNGSAYLTEQIQSILDQNVPVAEIVLSDDASTDDSVSLVESLVDRHHSEHRTALPALVVLRNAQALGVTANFEQAVRACTGDLVSLCDQDDRWQQARIEEIIREFGRRPDLTLLHHDARLVDDRGAPLGTTLAQAIGFTASEQRRERGGKAFDVLLQRNTVTGATTVFRRELVSAAVPFPAAWVHDEWLAMIASIVGVVDYLPAQLIDYRQHSANQIGARKATVADKVARLTQQRSDRNSRLLARAMALAERGEKLGAATARTRTLVERKCEHERWRSGLPSSRFRRIWPVLGGAMSGRYHRFGRARYDVVRDLIQPAG